ncbi:MAG TPA: hypothetical protein VKF60_14240 [Myxococcota bacterium]|nr:hypothetical protein [Myxococcota bacterium]
MSALELPSEINNLIASGSWPLTGEEMWRSGRVPSALVAQLVPLYDDVGLCVPPFKTVFESLQEEGSQGFFHEYGAIDEIDPARTLVIGDFGIGSDAPIALDYRISHSPRVIYLYYEPMGQDLDEECRTHWAVCCETFAAFSEALGLARCSWR